jgi:Tol biopolymer transport system component
MHLDLSRDGKWIKYIRSPEGSLWRMTSDGRERLQLTASPLFPLKPTVVARRQADCLLWFSTGRGNPALRGARSGGAVRQLTDGKSESSAEVDANWSPDSRSLVICARFVDMKTRHVSKLPGSQSLWSPRWSPDGRYIAAPGPGIRLWLYPVETHARTQMTEIGAGWPALVREWPVRLL